VTEPNKGSQNKTKNRKALPREKQDLFGRKGNELYEGLSDLRDESKQKRTQLEYEHHKTGFKTNFFIKDLTRIQRSTEVTALPPSFDWKLKSRHDSLLT
jgi:hypothetical protein